jgi:hypothetical protein
MPSLRLLAIFAVLLYGSVPATAATGASAAELMRCAEIATRDERLDCYDLLAHRSVDRESSAAAQKPAVAAAAETTAAADSAPSSSPPAASAPSDPKNFGLSAAQQHIFSNGPRTEHARVTSVSSDNIGHSYVVLDSGQTWMVLDNDGWLSAGDEVTIKRAVLGSFLMVVSHSHYSYRVNRTH